VRSAGNIIGSHILQEIVNMQIKTLSFILFITLATNISTPCSAFLWKSLASQQQKKIDEANKNAIKALCALFTALLLPIALENYFEYQDDKAISKIKLSDSEYQNAMSWKDKAKISKSIEREYYTTQFLKKKWRPIRDYFRTFSFVDENF